MINAITSFFDNAKEKLTNPFFGTLILVWLVRNWELTYTLFNFDKDCNLEDKKAFIIKYFQPKSFWNELFCNVGIAMGLMLFGYLLIVISRVIVNVVENNLMPFLNKKTVSKLVTNIGIHEHVVKQRDEYFEKYNVEREKAIDAVRAYDNLKNSSEKEIEDFQNRIDILDDEISNLGIENEELQEKTNSLNENVNSQKQLVKQIETTLQSKDNELTDIKLKLFRKTEDLNSLETIILNEIQDDYLNTTNDENTGRNINLNEIYLELKKKDLIIPFSHFVNAINGENESSLNKDYVDDFIKMKLLRLKDPTSKKSASSFNIEITSIGKIMSSFIGLKNE